MKAEARKYQIQKSIQNFSEEDFSENSLSLLSTLGYRSDKRFDDLEITPINIDEVFPSEQTFRHDKALTKQWTSVDLLFQLTGEDIVNISQGRLAFKDRVSFDPAIYQSYLFFAVELKSDRYTRNQLALITREINKIFLIPVMVLFKHGDTITLAIINRRPHKREVQKDILEKVTLIKDIKISSPHRAHIEILNDLSLEELQRQHSITNFLDLHKAWQTTLDISELNKRFFSDLSNWFYWAVENVTFPEGAGEDFRKRNEISVIRLITRLIFIWFVKEKGLVPEELFSQRALQEIVAFKEPGDTVYYKAVLQNLFFATLNQFMNKDTLQSREFAKELGSRKDDYLVPNKYRYSSWFKKPEEYLAICENIPFLNGGLFECLDREVGEEERKNNPELNKILTREGTKYVLRVDGFSRRKDNPLEVPDFLFFGDEQNVDLNQTYGISNRRYKVQGLIHILDHYKFTIEENTPIEEEVALDPELLGKVFENLLAAYNPETRTTARKQTGSYYTPREIVDYMVDEALMAYLETVHNSSPTGRGESGMRERLLQLFTYNEEPHHFSPDEEEALIKAIDDLNVLDPAVGSGAFPMGVLHKLVFILGKLDKNNERWRELQRRRAIRETEEAYKIGDQEERQKRLIEIDNAFEKNASNYGRKLYLIQNCIYGVDIQPIAVQIAKLRFFISLIIDETVDNTLKNRGIIPLPNLETRFLAANTLIELEKPLQPTLPSQALLEKQQKLAEVRAKHFGARTYRTKKKYRELDKKLRAEISTLLQREGFPSATATQLASWDPYDQNTSAGFFDPEWMFGLTEKFHVVIGNPPYLRVQGIQQTQPEYMPYYRERYQSARGNFDLYALFIERGYQLLASDGQFAYIVPRKFFQAAFGEALRRLLTNRGALRQIVRFGSAQVFEESTTYTCLLFLSAQPNNEFDLLEVKTLARGEDVLQAARERIKHPDYAFERLAAPYLESNDQAQPWNFAVGGHQKILQRLRQHPQTLGDITRKIFVGLQTSSDRIYVLEVREERQDTLICHSQHIDEVVEIERSLVKPFLMGKDVHRYEPVVAPNVVIFPYDIRDNRAVLMRPDYIQREFPLGWMYLKANEQALGDRERGRMHGDNFYAYIYPKNLTEFDTVKIITPDICGKPEMSIDRLGELYHTTTLYSFVFNPELHKSPKFYLGVMNSKLMWYFLSMTGSVLRGGYLRFKTNYLNPFPIAESIPEQESSIETLVDYILYLKAQPEPDDKNAAANLRVMTAYYEQLIDALVYEMYFPEEFEDSGKYPSRLLTPEILPVIKDLSGDKAIALREIFQRIYNPNHPVRGLIFFLDSIETIQIIEAKSKLQ